MGVSSILAAPQVGAMAWRAEVSTLNDKIQKKQKYLNINSNRVQF